MEVLKTSETLEKQILEDARKKASRVLDGAEREIAAIRGEWEAKVDAEARRAEAEFEARAAGLRKQLASSLPLDFLRTRLASIERTVTKALAELFAEMPDSEISRILGLFLKRAAPVFRGARLSVACQGIDPEEARRIVRESLPDASVESVEAALQQQEEEGGGLAGLPRKGIIVTRSDGGMRYRSTLREACTMLLEERREELVAALLGKDA